MGRIRTEVSVNGRKFWTLFDSGSRNCYLTEAAARGIRRETLKATHKVGLGGRTHTLKTLCVVQGKIGGKPFEADAYVVSVLRKDDTGRPLDMVFGALAMQKWGIALDLQRERLDLTHFTKEFIEF